MAETGRKRMNIYESISKCMEEIGAVSKDAVNKQQGFKYRDPARTECGIPLQGQNGSHQHVAFEK